jgi:hypothetical protein
VKLEFNKAYVVTAAKSVATNATHEVSFDTSDCDSGVFAVLVGSNFTASATFSMLKFAESDTVTSPSSMTDIVALTGGTAISSTAGFVLPTGNEIYSGGLAVLFQLDLRKRKKYVGIRITPGQTLPMCVIGSLTKGQSTDTAVEKAQKNLASLSVKGCAKVVEV